MAFSAISRQGMLIAYSTPANIKQLRDQAALASMTLQGLEHRSRPRDSKFDGVTDVLTDDQGIALFTIAGSRHNMVVQRLQPDLYIVLIGGVSEHIPADFDAPTGESIIPDDLLDASNSSAFSKMLLQVHKAKTSTIVSYARAELNQSSDSSDLVS